MKMSAQPLFVKVGSVNAHTLAAVTTAVPRIFGSDVVVSSGHVRSGVADQPWGDQTLRGAENRARAVWEQGSVDIGIGIEAGLLDDDDGLVESVSWVVAVGRRADGTVCLGRSRAASYLLPSALAHLVRGGASLGNATQQLYGSRTDEGTVGPLTGGRFDRRSHYVDAVMLALVPFYPDNAGQRFD